MIHFKCSFLKRSYSRYIVLYVNISYRYCIETTLVKDSDHTTRFQPMSSSPDIMYVAQVVYEQQGDRQWLVHFIVAKHSNSLLEVSMYVYIS